MQKQQGFSLLEVLVTLVIISFGLLGIAGAMVNSLKNNQSSTARTQATVLANDIIDRMRANRTTAETAPYAYNLASGAPLPTAGNAVVLNDLTQWRAALAAAMPAGTGSVAMASPAQVTVVVQWNDARAGSNTGNATQTITVQTRL